MEEMMRELEAQGYSDKQVATFVDTYESVIETGVSENVAKRRALTEADIPTFTL